MSLWGYVGSIGAGKTMNAVKYACWLAWRRNALLISNITIMPAGKHLPWEFVEGKNFHQLAVGLDGPIAQELMEWISYARINGHGVVILLDEIQVLYPSRAWASFPVDLFWLLTQSRHMGVDMVYTAQYPEQIDSNIRNLTESLEICKCWPRPSIDRRERKKRPLIMWTRTWQPRDIDKGKTTGWIKLEPYLKRNEKTYNTDHIISPRSTLRKAVEVVQFEHPPQVVSLEEAFSVGEKFTETKNDIPPE
jgi:hypothetical protein